MTPTVPRDASRTAARHRFPGVPRVLGGWVSGVLVTTLLGVATIPAAVGDDRLAVIVAVLLSLAAGVAVRYPVLGGVVIGGVLTFAMQHGPAHVGTGILASPVVIAACAARGHLVTAILLGLWHMIPSTISSLQRGDELQYTIAQVMLWVVLQSTAVLAGSWARTVVHRAGAERARRISDLAEQRRAIARELHDTGVRAMTTVVMLAENAARREGTSPADAREFSRIAETARGSTEDLRVLLDGLRGQEPSEATENASVPETLEALRIRLLTEGFSLRVHTDGVQDLRVSPTGVLSRCVSEIEANLVRHADRCVPVTVLLERSAPEEDPAGERARGTLDLMVTNGVADDEQSGPRGGAGLAGMRERLETVDGCLETRREGRRFLTHLMIPDPESSEAI